MTAPTAPTMTRVLPLLLLSLLLFGDCGASLWRWRVLKWWVEDDCSTPLELFGMLLRNGDDEPRDAIVRRTMHLKILFDIIFLCLSHVKILLWCQIAKWIPLRWDTALLPQPLLLIVDASWCMPDFAWASNRHRQQLKSCENDANAKNDKRMLSRLVCTFSRLM